VRPGAITNTVAGAGHVNYAAATGRPGTQARDCSSVMTMRRSYFPRNLPIATRN
jgi:hypothetical protein